MNLTARTVKKSGKSMVDFRYELQYVKGLRSLYPQLHHKEKANKLKIKAIFSDLSEN